jgi:hypothetical protein
MQFTLSVYDENSKCKVCGAHASEYHNDGCEVGALRQELSRLTQRAADRQYLCGRCGYPESAHPNEKCAAFARR